MLPNGIYFDSNSNVQINILKSTKSIPYFLRIGSRQPLPSLKFQFDETCIGAEFEIYINLRDTVDCQIRIPLVDGGFRFSTKLSSNEEFIEDPSFSPTLIFDKTQVFFKIDSPLTIKSYQICDISNPDVPADQFVIQISPLHLVASCSKAKVTVIKKDVANGIEILIDRSKIVEPTTVKIPNSSIFSLSTVATAEAGIEWWWYVGGGILLFILLCVALPICIICIYRRKKKETTKRKIREVSKSIVSDEIQIQPKSNAPTKITKKNFESNEAKKKKSKDKKTEQTTNEEYFGHEIRILKSVERKPPGKLSKSFREKYGQKETVAVEKSEVKNPGAAPDDEENPLPSFMKNMGIVYKPDPEENNSRTTVQTTQNETTFDTGSTQNPSDKTQKSTTGSIVDKVVQHQKKPTQRSQSNDQSSKITLELN
uniref:Uncharacterized protein n=1 Tax=Panagrolaimus sp. ES5 TaxID=591445 RepID=A0AC34F2U8_9BILA